MKQILNSEKIPLKLWLSDIEAGALNQAKNLANLPFAFKHIAIMPDAHQGYGMPIGGVLATKDVIIPNAVGVDIGCGMCAVRTSLTQLNISALQRILGGSKKYKDGIKSKIPVGFNHHQKRQDSSLLPKLNWNFKSQSIVEQEYESALKQVGTLGGGNHFIEIQKGDDGFIWIMIHSGSRNIGYKVAAHYNKLAIRLNEQWKSNVPSKWQLAYLPLNSSEGQAYLREMHYCVEFAYANRKLMMDRAIESFIEVTGNVQFGQLTNIAHNYAALEKHFNENVIVHRKGATQANKGQTGIIPGSQGTASYIVSGKGNAESFKSCSHGAGRKMGRKQAQRELDLKREQKWMNDLGIIHSLNKQRDLDEATGAYKDIHQVMRNQQDLVEIVVELKPLGVVKG